MTYTIRQLSKMFDLPASTLRYYEELGLLTNINREGTNRMYQQCHVNHLKTICCFKESGMSLSQLRLFLEMENVPERGNELLDLLNDHAKKIDQQIFNLIENRKHIHRKQLFYEAKHKAYLANEDMPEWKNFKEKEVIYDINQK